MCDSSLIGSPGNGLVLRKIDQVGTHNGFVLDKQIISYYIYTYTYTIYIYIHIHRSIFLEMMFKLFGGC